MGFNIGSQYGRSHQRKRFPSGSSLDLLRLARDLLYRVRCPSQTAYYCLAGAESACKCLTSDLHTKASVEGKLRLTGNSVGYT
jgi:hypothetical protein